MLKLTKNNLRLDVRQFFVVLYDCIPNIKHVWSIGRLLKNANVLMSRQGKNPTDPLYSETAEPENFLNSKETIKNAKMKRQLHGYKAYASTYNVEILNTFNPELQLKDTELITAFQIIEDDDKSRT